MSKLKIAFLLPDLRCGGVERIRLVLAREFLNRGYLVEFVLMRCEGELLEEACSEFRVVNLGTPRIRQIIPALVSYLRKEKPDVIFSAMWPLTAIAPIVGALSLYKGKVVVSEHAILSRQYESWGWFHRVLLRLSTAIAYRLASARVGVSVGTTIDMAALSFMKSSEFDVINNPLRPLPKATADQLSATEHLWGGSKIRVLAVGSLKAVKNFDLLLYSFSKLPSDSARLIIVGDGPLMGHLKRSAEKLKIVDRVLFEGFRRDLAAYYQTANVFVLTSNNEGFGNVLVEALAHGLNVVSTDCPSGPREILGFGRYGRLSTVGDSASVVESILDVMLNPIAPDILRQRADDFSPSVAAEKYLNLVELT